MGNTREEQKRLMWAGRGPNSPKYRELWVGAVSTAHPKKWEPKGTPQKENPSYGQPTKMPGEWLAENQAGGVETAGRKKEVRKMRSNFELRETGPLFVKPRNRTRKCNREKPAKTP